MIHDTQTIHAATSHERWIAPALLVAALVVYNANGREIGSYDSRPTELAARELVLRGTLALNHVVGATPEYAQRWGVVLGRDGRFRSVYSPLPAIAAAAVAWPFWKLHLIDVRAPLAPRLMAAATASLIVALAVVACYHVARRWVSPGRAAAIAGALAFGTGFWSTASQTLWQTETAVLGLSLAILGFCDGRPRARATALVGAGLALALLARPQLGPAAAVLIGGVWRRRGIHHVAGAGGIMIAALIPMAILYWRWFGNPLGPLPLLEDANAAIHHTGRTFGWDPAAWAGLLVSPNRGLLVFSPVVLVAVAGLPGALKRGTAEPFMWCAAAAIAQYALYASYSVWWGGHTYGPRYLLDILPFGVPLAALAMSRPHLSPLWITGASLLLTWSIVVSATGAFCYPNDAWNSDPVDVDRDHARLWSVSDMQIVRCWKAGPSPQNFNLFSRAAVRRAGE